MSTKGRVDINLRDVLAKLMAHAPRGLIGDAKLALQFLGGNAMPRCGEQIRRIEPLLQRCMAVLEWRSDHRVNVIATSRTGIGGKFFELGEQPFIAALLAKEGVAKTLPHKVFQAGIIGWKHLEETLNRQPLSHRFELLCQKCRLLKSYVKGIMVIRYYAGLISALG